MLAEQRNETRYVHRATLSPVFLTNATNARISHFCILRSKAADGTDAEMRARMRAYSFLRLRNELSRVRLNQGTNET
jgi:hypothetical protein